MVLKSDVNGLIIWFFIIYSLKNSKSMLKCKSKLIYNPNKKD